MTSTSTSSKPKGMKKRSFGSIRARAGLPAKAGKRKLPVLSKNNSSITTLEERARAKFFSSLGLKPEPFKRIHPASLFAPSLNLN